MWLGKTMTRIRYGNTNWRLRCVSLIIFGIFSLGSASAKESEEVWKELSKLSGDERKTFLLSRARAEGEVVWYSSMNVDSLKPLKDGFEKSFPELKVRIWRGSGERVLNRVFTEARTGKSKVDVIGVGSKYLPPMMSSGLVGRYSSPERNFYPDIYKDQDGYWVSDYHMIGVIAYNTNLVPRSEAPRRYEDFLHPRWRDSFAIDPNSDRTIMGWLKTWGDEKTENFLRNLMQNGPVIRRGHTLTTQLLCAGEFKAALELFAYRVLEVKQKGCPVELVFPDPTPSAPALVYVARQSPHPYAAALLIDYILSQAGQRILMGKGWYSGRNGIKPKYPPMELEKAGAKILFLGPEDAQELEEKYLHLREQFFVKRPPS